MPPDLYINSVHQIWKEDLVDRVCSSKYPWQAKSHWFCQGINSEFSCNLFKLFLGHNSETGGSWLYPQVRLVHHQGQWQGGWRLVQRQGHQRPLSGGQRGAVRSRQTLWYAVKLAVVKNLVLNKNWFIFGTLVRRRLESKEVWAETKVDISMKSVVLIMQMETNWHQYKTANSSKLERNEERYT